MASYDLFPFMVLKEAWWCCRWPYSLVLYSSNMLLYSFDKAWSYTTYSFIDKANTRDGRPQCGQVVTWCGHHGDATNTAHHITCYATCLWIFPTNLISTYSNLLVVHWSILTNLYELSVTYPRAWTFVRTFSDSCDLSMIILQEKVAWILFMNVNLGLCTLYVSFRQETV